MTLVVDSEVDYVWMDASCIVQDDNYDCLHEIAHIAPVCEGALLVLIMAWAGIPSNGCRPGLIRSYGWSAPMHARKHQLILHQQQHHHYHQ